ncbi:farnesyl pyrophosphate synthase [Monomorium pharaonis]|uniref:farnesyl pyrophosphate synthase n=1 Tax=Monomorium pharaonis TaxID=307658 RepID=UPI00063EE6A2|nr:farnesyl pyrophosphate synthase [Monomorium pharaonis]
MTSSITQTMWITMEKEIQELMAVWPDVVHDITEVITNLNIPDVDKWLEKVLQYNVPGSKKLYTLLLVYAYKSLIPNEQLTEDNIRLVRILAWCMEMTIAYLLIIDDILDQSSFRRGQPCWYRYSNIGLMAVNDSLLLQSAVYYLIQKHFKGKECYIKLVETFQDATFKTQIGQCLDMYSTKFNKKPNNSINLNQFTINYYRSIIKYKTYLSVVSINAAMHFAGIKNPEMFKQSKTIVLETGYLYQIQDDYLSCFGNFETLLKNSTDIEEGKCTWLVVTALQRVTPEQRKILEECYGVSDPDKVKRVKQLFIDIDLPNIYFTYEKEIYDQLRERISKSCKLLHNLFFGFLEKIYHRQNCHF